MSVLVDTNIIIDLLNGHAEAHEYLRSLQEINVSSITIYEVLSGCLDAHADQLKTAELLLSGCNVLPVTYKVSARAAQYQRRWKLKRKMADFLIEATAEEHGLKLATRNPQDFRHIRPLQPYSL